jgi:hypothetical protein
LHAYLRHIQIGILKQLLWGFYTHVGQIFGERKTGNLFEQNADIARVVLKVGGFLRQGQHLSVMLVPSISEERRMAPCSHLEAKPDGVEDETGREWNRVLFSLSIFLLLPILYLTYNIFIASIRTGCIDSMDYINIKGVIFRLLQTVYLPVASRRKRHFNAFCSAS